MRFKIGDKVIVKSFSKSPDYWDCEGKMEKWMGKIVTIRKYREGLRNPYSIEEDEEEYLGDGWHWSESDFLPIPKPGDRVKLRTWEDMEKQYGEQIIHPDLPKSVKTILGKIFTVSEVYDFFFRTKEYGSAFGIQFKAIEEVYPKEEKMEFTKDMLKSGEHVVEYRNGKRALYVNGYFVSDDGYMDSKDYDSSLIETKYGDIPEYDIAAVYKIIMYSSFQNILNRCIDRIWKRDDEPIEIPSSEAFAKLKEIYGKEVKIVEDKND